MSFRELVLSNTKPQIENASKASARAAEFLNGQPEFLDAAVHAAIEARLKEICDPFHAGDTQLDADSERRAPLSFPPLECRHLPNEAKRATCWN